MARTAKDIEAEMAALKAAGEPAMSKTMRGLRALLKEAEGQAPATEPAPAPAAPAFDVRALVMSTLAARAATGKAEGNVERLYSAVREAASVGAIIHEALDPKYASQRDASGLPPYDALGRERYSGRKFKPGETQAIVDGMVLPPQKSKPAANGATNDRDAAMKALMRPSLESLVGAAEKATLSHDPGADE